LTCIGLVYPRQSREAVTPWGVPAPCCCHQEADHGRTDLRSLDASAFGTALSAHARGPAWRGRVGASDVAKSRKKRKKKIKRNALGCVDVGRRCKNASQCSSGICSGKKRKRKCRAHDQSTCQNGQDFCLGVEVACTATTGRPGECATTTGAASYCAVSSSCAVCVRDADCEPTHGVGAACTLCASECAGSTPNGTACSGLNVQA
jgi:hypothetical protein